MEYFCVIIANVEHRFTLVV